MTVDGAVYIGDEYNNIRVAFEQDASGSIVDSTGTVVTSLIEGMTGSVYTDESLSGTWKVVTLAGAPTLIIEPNAGYEEAWREDAILLTVVNNVVRMGEYQTLDTEYEIEYEYLEYNEIAFDNIVAVSEEAFIDPTTDNPIEVQPDSITVTLAEIQNRTIYFAEELTTGAVRYGKVDFGTTLRDFYLAEFDITGTLTYSLVDEQNAFSVTTEGYLTIDADIGTVDIYFYDYSEGGSIYASEVKINNVDFSERLTFATEEDLIAFLMAYK